MPLGATIQVVVKSLVVCMTGWGIDAYDITFVTTAPLQGWVHTARRHGWVIFRRCNWLWYVRLRKRALHPRRVEQACWLIRRIASSGSILLLLHDDVVAVDDDDLLLHRLAFGLLKWLRSGVLQIQIETQRLWVHFYFGWLLWAARYIALKRSTLMMIDHPFFMIKLLLLVALLFFLYTRLEVTNIIPIKNEHE